MQIQEKEDLLKSVITKTQTNIENTKLDLLQTYEKQVNTLLSNKPLIDQFKKQTKEYDENIQFYIKEVTPPDLFTITAKYMGTGIMTITISKDKTIVTTEEYNKSNEELFNCDIQLKDEEFYSINTARFLNYFNRRYKTKS